MQISPSAAWFLQSSTLNASFLLYSRESSERRSRCHIFSAMGEKWKTRVSLSLWKRREGRWDAEKDRSDRGWTDSGRAAMEDWSYRCSDVILRRLEFESCQKSTAPKLRARALYGGGKLYNILHMCLRAHNGGGHKQLCKNIICLQRKNESSMWVHPGN